MKRRIIALTLTTILGITALMGCSSTQVGSNKTTESTEITCSLSVELYFREYVCQLIR